MNHLSEDLLNEFLDSELAEKARTEVEAHLAGCSECRANMEELRNLFTELGQLPDEAPSRDLYTLALTRLPEKGLSMGARLGLALQAGAALGLLVLLFQVAWQYIASVMNGLHLWEWLLSRPISLKLPVIELSLPKLTACKLPISLPVLVVMLLIVVVFWWLGNIRLLRDGNEYQI